MRRLEAFRLFFSANLRSSPPQFAVIYLSIYLSIFWLAVSFPDLTVEISDQVIREDPAGAVVVRARGRGTETSAEVLVGPPWRMESNAGQQQWY